MELINDNIVDIILEHSYRLNNLKYCLNMLRRFIEDDGYIESNSELCSFANIINEYCINTNNNFSKIEEKFDIN